MSHHRTIFLVDDDPDILVMERAVLEAAGYAVETASSGAEAVERLETLRPDLILLDVMMEDTASGFDVLRTVREDPALAATPVVLITSVQQRTQLALEGRFERGQIPAQGFMEKPVSPKDLVAKAKELIAE